ncbi:hypothetical protein PFTANZ_02199 [Plasmodium falciparum Tanzania (2000708)]|uniref:Uncharacterized protein n=1 Tax=Plasmodium falciparum Tanzania (2000708) TaxID=1036725 RepID=A0A024WA66_PLAFA|nr:hypothetical protein PFTANZ_02199 [Plasmodium falciparum Tanzania (2000708)]
MGKYYFFRILKWHICFLFFFFYILASQVIFLLLDFTLNVNIVFTHIYLLILFFLILFEYRKKFSERAPFYNNIYNA